MLLTCASCGKGFEQTGRGRPAHRCLECRNSNKKVVFSPPKKADKVIRKGDYVIAPMYDLFSTKERAEANAPKHKVLEVLGDKLRVKLFFGEGVFPAGRFIKC